MDTTKQQKDIRKSSEKKMQNQIYIVLENIDTKKIMAPPEY